MQKKEEPPGANMKKRILINLLFEWSGALRYNK